MLIETPTLNAAVSTAFKLTGNAVSTSTGGTFDYRVVDAGGAPITAGKVKVLASPGARGPFVEPVKLPLGTNGGITLIIGPPDSEQRTPLNITP